MLMRTPILVLLGLTMLGGCAHGGGNFADGRYTNRDLTYRLGELPSGWRVDDNKTADVAFVHREMSASIYVDNSCRRYTDAGLNTLANHLFYGFEDVDVLSQEYFELDGREALRRVARARLDGVLVELGVTVVKKNTCIFDLVLVAPRDRFDRAFEDYTALIDGFAVELCP
jgi:hypothetical protein